MGYTSQDLFQAFLLPNNGGKNSVLNWVLKMNLVQQNIF